MRLPSRVANGRGRALDAPLRLNGATLQVAAPWLLALFIALLLTWLTVGPLGIGLSNNGDGWRLLRRAWAVDPLVGQPHPLADVYDMAPWTFDNLAQGLPRSTSGVVFFLIAALSQALGETRFQLPFVTLVYHLVYVTGLVRWVQTSASRGERAASIILWGGLLLSPYTLSVFHSVLEEAAFVALLPWWTHLLRQVWHQRHGHGLTAFIGLSLGVLLAKPQTAILLPLVLGVLWRARGRAQHAPFNGFNRLSGVAHHPTAWWASVREAWWTAVNADYSMSYITMQNGRLGAPGESSLFRRLMSCAGALWWALLALTLWSGLQRRMLPLALGLTLLCTPTVVVLGDGYYEFERHLLPYLTLLPGMAALLLPVARRRALARPAKQTGGPRQHIDADHDVREAA